MNRKRAIRDYWAKADLCLELTFSPAAVGKHLGIGPTAVQELINYGLKYKAHLHPTRGGLYPTHKYAKFRRIPLSAIERHKRHMARLDGIQELPPTLLVECKYVESIEKDFYHDA